MSNQTNNQSIGKWRQRIGYGSSDFACNLIWQMISLYLLYFYTNVMHLNAAAVSVMFLVTKVFDGVTDLIVGFLIDKTNTRWGKSRPWILFGAIPFGITSVLAFSVPNISQTGMLIYAYVTYILLSLSYTIVNIPMASILPSLTEDPQERTVLASCRTFFSSIGSTVVSAFALNIIWFFGGYVIQASAVIYYFTYVVANEALVQIVATITTLVPIVANLCAPFLTKLTTKRTLMIAGNVLHSAGLL